ncbi:hypothetical protein [Hymenobacter sp. CRA2]|uniref:hypothetical protein n=1 Tax=Hymenobacter sp. CRA2 TaxID=1955620 RepID=UPI0009901D3C|nr:hypothetical protein [Hymenobacter sp. CRA2]OON71067.1 hypothetical protein B0919_03490 [Hymenobacter sp. CRA2]
MRKLSGFRPAAAALILLLGGGVGAACSSGGDDIGARPARRPAGYFDTQTLLNAQVQRLQRQRPALEKRVMLRDALPETAKLPQPDWARELQLFYQADINKPALRGAYQVLTSDSAGFTRRIFRRLPEVDHPVLALEVVQDDSVVRELRATLEQRNPLFFSGKKLQLRFGADGLLSDYEVQGRQKLVGFDTTRYVSSARVLR